MHMGDFLSCCLAVGLPDADTRWIADAAQRFGNLDHRNHQRCRVPISHLVNQLDVLTRKYQEVCDVRPARLSNVHDPHGVLVLVEPLARDFTSDDLAEEARHVLIMAGSGMVFDVLHIIGFGEANMDIAAHARGRVGTSQQTIPGGHRLDAPTDLSAGVILGPRVTPL